VEQGSRTFLDEADPSGRAAVAIAAAWLGRRVLLTEETHWLGGQLTNQGVNPAQSAGTCSSSTLATSCLRGCSSTFPVVGFSADRQPESKEGQGRRSRLSLTVRPPHTRARVTQVECVAVRRTRFRRGSS
jgi:hypothetical protein